MICFRSGSPADERLILPLFIPYIEQGEIANLPAYNFYARIAAIQAQEPMSGNTMLLDYIGSDEIAQSVIEQSRQQYGVKVSAAKPAAQQAEQNNVKNISKKKPALKPLTKNVERQSAIPIT